MAGADANWGRVLCAVGYSGAAVDVDGVAVRFASAAGTVAVCSGGRGVPFSEELAHAVLSEDEVEILLDLVRRRGLRRGVGVRPHVRIRKDQQRLQDLKRRTFSMQLTNAQRAEVLCNALPYIQAYKDKIVVVKYGGNAMVNEDIKRSVMGDVMLLRLIGVRVVVVHGGGPEISGLLKRLGKQSTFVDGLRVTDAETAEVVQMVLAGKVNKSLVSLLQTLGGRAVGLCGLDGGMIEARQLDERLGFVGEITRVDPQIVLDVLEKGYIPVVSTVARGENGETYNINADTAAARLAAALRAECPHLHDGHRRRAARPARPAVRHPVHRRERGAAAHARGRHLRRHDPQDRLLHRGHPPRREEGVRARRHDAARQQSSAASTRASARCSVDGGGGHEGGAALCAGQDDPRAAGVPVPRRGLWRGAPAQRLRRAVGAAGQHP